MLNAMAGFDARDSTSLERATGRLHARSGQSRSTACASACRRSISAKASTSDVARAVDAAIAEYRKLGATTVEVSLPKTELSVPVYYVIAPAEASTNLSRFDGVRYGHRARNTTTCSTCIGRRAPKASARK